VHVRVAPEPRLLTPGEAPGLLHGLLAGILLGDLPGEEREHLLVSECAAGRDTLAQAHLFQGAHLVDKAALPHHVHAARNAVVKQRTIRRQTQP